MQFNSSSEAESCSASQEFPRLLRKPKAHFIHDGSPLDINMDHFNPLRSLQPYLCSINFNIILVPLPMSPKTSLPFTFCK